MWTGTLPLQTLTAVGTVQNATKRAILRIKIIRPHAPAITPEAVHTVSARAKSSMVTALMTIAANGWLITNNATPHPSKKRAHPRARISALKGRRPVPERVNNMPIPRATESANPTAATGKTTSRDAIRMWKTVVV